MQWDLLIVRVVYDQHRGWHAVDIVYRSCRLHPQSFHNTDILLAATRR